MFVALRDLRFAKGRFLLMTSVIALITVLVGFLASLTAGLGRASISAIVDLPAAHLAFAQAPGADPSFTESQVDPSQWQGWAQVPGVESAEPLGIAQTRASVADTTAAVTAFGLLPGSELAPSAVSDGEVIVSSGAAEALGAAEGASLTIGQTSLTVHAVVDDDAEYAHTPVVWISLADWQAVGARGGTGTADGSSAGDEGTTGHSTADASNVGSTDLVATVVAVRTADGSRLPATTLTAADADLATQTLGLADARSAISSYAAENLSLTMMQTFLVAISALVVGAFFTVWTINRGRDIAVLKALGASNRYLLKDAIGQALIVLALGTGAGATLAAGLGLAAAQVMPVVIGASTIVVPALLLAALGLVGALLAVARITRIDPHAALAAR